MTVLKACAIAFSMYSQIPMPQFVWKERELKYVLAFFPLIGVVIGLCLAGWFWLAERLSMGRMAYVLFGMALPILVTGGFHVDGYMDTMDALHSYQDRERKLEILKDSHVGAFSVIMLLLYYLVYGAAFSEIRGREATWVVCVGFALSRAMSGIAVLSFPPARKEGMLRGFSDRAAKGLVRGILLVETVLLGGGMLWIAPKIGALVLMGALFTFLYYYWRSRKEFGGITGDVAGWFVLLCELGTVLLAALGEKLPLLW